MNRTKRLGGVKDNAFILQNSKWWKIKVGGA